MINRSQNKSFCLRNIGIMCIFYYVYINSNICMYVFKKSMFIYYIFIYNIRI